MSSSFDLMRTSKRGAATETKRQADPDYRWPGLQIRRAVPFQYVSNCGDSLVSSRTYTWRKWFGMQPSGNKSTKSEPRRMSGEAIENEGGTDGDAD